MCPDICSGRTTNLRVNPSISDGGAFQVDELSEPAIMVTSDDPCADSWDIVNE